MLCTRQASLSARLHRLLSSFASPAVPDTLKAPPGQGRRGGPRGSRRSLWGTGAGNCPRVLVTSMKVVGLFCKPRAGGSRGSQAGRCHLHDPGPGPPPGRGGKPPLLAAVGLPRGRGTARCRARHRSLPHAVLHGFLGDTGTAHRDVSRLRGPPGELAPWDTGGSSTPPLPLPAPAPTARLGPPPPGLRGGAGPGQRVFPGLRDVA